jgi:hypothetical protein
MVMRVTVSSLDGAKPSCERSDAQLATFRCRHGLRRENPTVKAEEPKASTGWLNRGVLGIGLASLLADAGHEIPTARLPGSDGCLLPYLAI